MKLNSYLRILQPKWLAVKLIRGYQLFISPYLGDKCRYYPSCSAYAIEAYTKKGFIRGTLLTGYRLLRCNPFSHGGFDPVDKSDDFYKEISSLSFNTLEEENNGK